MTFICMTSCTVAIVGSTVGEGEIGSSCDSTFFPLHFFYIQKKPLISSNEKRLKSKKTCIILLHRISFCFVCWNAEKVKFDLQTYCEC